MKILMKSLVVLVCFMGSNAFCPPPKAPTAKQTLAASKKLDKQLQKESESKIKKAKQDVAEAAKKHGAGSAEVRGKKEDLDRARASHAALSAPTPQGYSVSSTRAERNARRATEASGRSASVPSLPVSRIGSDATSALKRSNTM
jgi:hypothetical protein